MLAKIWPSSATTFSSKLQSQLFGEILYFRSIGENLAIAQQFFLELLGLLNWKTWHISCIPFFTVSATQLSLHTKKLPFKWGFVMAAFPLSKHRRSSARRSMVPCPALPQLKICPGSLQADWRRAVYVFKHDMHGKSVLPDVFSNLPWSLLSGHKRRNSSCGDV